MVGMLILLYIENNNFTLFLGLEFKKSEKNPFLQKPKSFVVETIVKFL